MGKVKDLYEGIHRRAFLKVAGLSSLGLGLGFLMVTKWGNVSETPAFTPMVDWKRDKNGNKYFIPANIRTDFVNDRRIVIAKVDGTWRKYKVREFDSDFFDWWVTEKIWYYDQLTAFIEGETDQFTIPNGGHHHPMLSTYGMKLGGRSDSDFHLNTAAKGFTIVPKPENMQLVKNEIQKALESGNSPVNIFKVKRQLYQEKSLWDMSRFVTLELYTGRPINTHDTAGSFGYTETHTFQNINVNPVATLTYMSIFNTDGTQSYFEGLPYLTPHFEFRGLCWLISYYNPHNTEYEKAIAEYVNQAHCQFHGGVCDIMANIFLVAEEFNNTPGYGPGMGKRAVPPHEYDHTKVKAALKISAKKKLNREERIEFVRNLPISL